MNRRLLLTSCAALAALAGCATTTTVDPTQAIADARLIVDGIEGVYDKFIALYPDSVSIDRQTDIAADFDAARKALTQLSATASALTNSNGLQDVEIAVANVLSALGAVVRTIPGVPAEITVGITAAQVLLPLIEATVNALLGKPAAMAAARQAMGYDQARLVLRAGAGR